MEDCSICTEPINPTTNVSVTSCNHTFHFECLFKWNVTNTTCPLCRREFAPPARSELYQLLGVQLPIDFSFQRVTVMSPVSVVGPQGEEADIELIMTQLSDGRHPISHDMVRDTLRRLDGDIVDTIMALSDHGGLTIPPFRQAEHQTRTTYESKVVHNRVRRRDSGYASS